MNLIIFYFFYDVRDLPSAFYNIMMLLSYTQACAYLMKKSTRICTN